MYTRKNDRSQEGEGGGGGKSWLLFDGKFICLFAGSTNKPTKQTESWETAKVLHIYVRRAMYLAGIPTKSRNLDPFPFLPLSLSRPFSGRAFSNIHLTSLRFQHFCPSLRKGVTGNFELMQNFKTHVMDVDEAPINLILIRI